MSTTNSLKCFGVAFAALCVVQGAFAQPNFTRTLIVDPSGSPDANFTTIQAAIDFIPDDPTERRTILIYAATYAEAVTLGDTKENVDLVGVDRDAVIIKPPADSDGITIQGDGARNNTIRNLTIITNDDDANQGRGIVIKEQTPNGNPSAIRIIDVTIKCDGENSNAVHLVDQAEDIEIRGVKINCNGNDSIGIYVSEALVNALFRDLTIRTSAGDGIVFAAVTTAKGKSSTRIEIEDTRIEARGAGSYALKAAGAESIPGGRRVRIDALTLYPESAPHNTPGTP